jgi:hypothetical protein
MRQFLGICGHLDSALDEEKSTKQKRDRLEMGLIHDEIGFSSFFKR